MKLDRKDQILRCIVEEYIKTAEPVGSENLLKNYNLKCSSATIRNAMAQLEKDGYLEKTHISSGRVPSAKGYQHYLEHLEDSKSLDSIDMDFQRELVRYLSDPTLGVEEMTSKVCQVLSEMTNMVVVKMKPEGEEKLLKIELIPLSDDNILGLIITDKGNILHKTFLLNKSHFFDLSKAVNFVYLLSNQIKGYSLTEVLDYIEKNHEAIEKEFGYVGIICLTALKESITAYLLSETNRWKMFGKYNLLTHSEYSSNPEAIVKALQTLAEPSMLPHDIASSDDLGDVKVSFTNDVAGDLAIVTRTLINDEQISVIGPKRMDYKKVFSSLDYVCYLIESYIKGIKAKDGSLTVSIDSRSDRKEIINERRKRK